MDEEERRKGGKREGGRRRQLRWRGKLRRIENGTEREREERRKQHRSERNLGITEGVS